MTALCFPTIWNFEMATGGRSEDNTVYSHFRDLISDLNSVSQDLDDSDQPEFESSNCKYYECHELTAMQT